MKEDSEISALLNHSGRLIIFSFCVCVSIVFLAVDFFRYNSRFTYSSLFGNLSKGKSDRTKIAMTNLFITNEDGKPWKYRPIDCFGLWTFIQTFENSSTDFVVDHLLFHNQVSDIDCGDLILSKNGISLFRSIRFIQISKDWLIRRAMEIGFNATRKVNNGHAICDFKPLHGILFNDYLIDYDYFIYGDIDGIFGRTDLFNSLTFQFDVISQRCNSLPIQASCGTARSLASGSFTMVKISEAYFHLLRGSMKKWTWKSMMESGREFYLDESGVHEGFNYALHRDESLIQLCKNCSTKISQENAVFVFNIHFGSRGIASELNKNVYFRWDVSNGMVFNYTNLMGKAHFTHWLDLKYNGKERLEKILHELLLRIPNLTCFELLLSSLEKSINAKICDEDHFIT